MTSTDTLFALAVLRNISSPNEHLVTLFGRSLQEGLQTKDPRTGGGLLPILKMKQGRNKIGYFFVKFLNRGVGRG